MKLKTTDCRFVDRRLEDVAQGDLVYPSLSAMLSGSGNYQCDHCGRRYVADKDLFPAVVVTAKRPAGGRFPLVELVTPSGVHFVSGNSLVSVEDNP